MFHFEWLIGCDLYVYDQTIGFKGMNVDKIRLSHKNKVYGFKVDAIRNRGYTYVFFLRNECVPKE